LTIPHIWYIILPSGKIFIVFGDKMNIKNIKDIARIIKQTRKKQNLTQVQLAGASGVGIRFIVDLEKGKETCQIGKTLRIIKMLGIDIDVVLPEGDK